MTHTIFEPSFKVVDGDGFIKSSVETFYADSGGQEYASDDFLKKSLQTNGLIGISKQNLTRQQSSR